jgi:hypothetical protein
VQPLHVVVAVDEVGDVRFQVLQAGVLRKRPAAAAWNSRGNCA